MSMIVYPLGYGFSSLFVPELCERNGYKMSKMPEVKANDIYIITQIYDDLQKLNSAIQISVFDHQLKQEIYLYK